MKGCEEAIHSAAVIGAKDCVCYLFLGKRRGLDFKKNVDGKRNKKSDRSPHTTAVGMIMGVELERMMEVGISTTTECLLTYNDNGQRSTVVHAALLSVGKYIMWLAA